jgi:hypothetical protein
MNGCGANIHDSMHECKQACAVPAAYNTVLANLCVQLRAPLGANLLQLHQNELLHMLTSD